MFASLVVGSGTKKNREGGDLAEKLVATLLYIKDADMPVIGV